MKLKLTLFTFLLFGLSVVMMSHAGGRAKQHQQGNTGAPGDNNLVCSTCHQGGNFGASIEIRMTDSDGNEVTEYEAGNTYTISAMVNTTTAPVGYGLQMVGLINASEENAGSFSTPSTNAQLVDLADRIYLEQAGLSASNTFTTEWTAPDSGSGSVTFYAAGHAANGNGQSSGDQATTGSAEFGENVVESTVDYDANLFSVNPNPVQDFTLISLDKEIKGTYSIISNSGQLVTSKEIPSTQFNIDMTTFNAGIYTLILSNETGNIVSSQQIIKM